MGNKEIKKWGALDLFAGAGGFSSGMLQAGFDIIAAIEYDKNIAKTYAYNHPGSYVFAEDIRTVKATSEDNLKIKNNLPDVLSLFEQKQQCCDVIFGGPPCQGFSMAGRRIRNSCSFLTDERNFLFKEFIRMVDHLQPKIFVLENVPGILNYNGGTVKDEIHLEFNKLGYNVSSQVVCAADYGVPQMRKRALFIGNRIGLNSEDLFPNKTHCPDSYVTVWDAISDLPPLQSGQGIEILKDYNNTKKPSDYQKKMISTSNILYNHVSAIHKEETIELLKKISEGQTMKDLPKKYQTKSVHSGAYGRMKKNEPAYTLTTRLNTPSVGRITHPEQHRTITPREAARIQSFCDDFRFVGDITSIGIQIGNAVPPLLGLAIGKKINQVLSEH